MDMPLSTITLSTISSTSPSAISTATSSTPPSLPYEKIEFENGCRLLLIPMTGVASVATAVMVNVGSRFETPEINGISHFLEHMVFKGTEKYPTTEDVNFIERLGGLQNAYTDIDVTNYHNKVLYTDWKSSLEINKELALYPRLEEQYVDKERNVILEEMKRYEDEPAAKVGEAFHTMLYPHEALGMRIIGEEAPLRAATSQTLRAYHDAWYVPERMVVVMSGNIEKDKDQMIASAKSWFGSLTKKSTGDMQRVNLTQTTPAVTFVTKPDASQAHLNLGVRIFNRTNDDRFGWNVFNLLFGVSFTSRLFKEIREKKGLCYTIRSGADTWDDVGYWSIYAGVATEKVKETVEGIMDELKKAVELGVTDEEVAVAKKRLLTMIAFKSEDPEFMTEFYGRQELYHLPIMTVDGYMKIIESITAEQIHAMIKKYFVTNTLNLAVVWNREADDSLISLLNC